MSGWIQAAMQQNTISDLKEQECKVFTSVQNNDKSKTQKDQLEKPVRN